MRISIIKTAAACAAFASAALWSGSLLAETCVDSGDDAFMTLVTDGSATVTCFDAGDQANPGQLPTSPTGPGTFGDDILNNGGFSTLVAKSDEANSFFNILSGSLTGGTTGTFTVNATGDLGLLFKSGGGNNDPSWWFFVVQGLGAGEIFTWNILGDPPINGLSHVSAYVPLPPAVWLLGSGLVALFGIGRRRKIEPVAA